MSETQMAKEEQTTERATGVWGIGFSPKQSYKAVEGIKEWQWQN
jgi:hypothetical protein